MNGERKSAVMSKPILYDYWRSSAAYRLRIALNHKGIAYDAVQVNLVSGEHRETANMVRNPQGLVPALEIDGRMLTQSLPIMEYLDETRPEAPLIPAEPGLRHHVRAVSCAIAMGRINHVIVDFSAAGDCVNRTPSSRF